MHHLTDIAIYLAAALIMVPLFRRLGFGAILGYLAAGIIIGPWGLRLIGEVDATMQIAEIGVVFLLFVIGLELKPSRLWVMRHAIFGNGSLQVGMATVPLAALAIWAFELSLGQALLVGFALALSSTAFVLQTLAERQQLGKVHGRNAFGILLFQDLAIIPALAILPLLADRPDDGGGLSLTLMILQGLAVIAALVLGGRYLLRPVFRAVARWGNEESFTITALLVVLGAALLMHWAGLSAGLGAFLAGVLLADSEFRHELEGNINPFKGLLLGLFFISVGMSANFGLLGEHAGLILAGTLALLVVKAGTIWLGARLLGVDQVNATQQALILAQGGEFAFVLFHAASGQGLLPHVLTEQLIAMVILSMILTPGLFALSDRIGRAARIRHRDKPDYDTIEPSETPVIIAGFGRMGQIIARVLQMRGIPFTALEKDSDHVAFVRRFGNKIYYGQSTNLETLRAAGAEHAQILIVTMDDVDKANRTIELAQRHFPKLKIFARARDRQHAMHLMAMGVDRVIRETWLSSLDMARDVLEEFGDEPAKAQHIISTFRRADEDLLRQQMPDRHDIDRMIQSSQAMRDELRQLFESDPRMTPEEAASDPESAPLRPDS